MARGAKPGAAPRARAGLCGIVPLVPLIPPLSNGLGVETWAATGLMRAQASDDAARIAAIARTWRYYDGNHDPALVVRHGEPDDNVVLNVVETAVDALTDFLFGETLHLDLLDVENDDERQLYIDATWRQSGGMRLLGDLRTNGAVSGHAFLSIDVTEGQFTRTVPPRLRVIDPSTMQVITAEDDYDEVVEYRMTWNVMRGGKPVAKRKRVIAEGLSWVIVHEESDQHSSRWTVTDTSTWLYPWAPIVATKNLPRPNAYWGRPDVDADLMRLQDAINAVGSDARRVSRLLGHSQVWASGVNDDDLTADPGEVIVLPDEGRMGVVGPPSTPDAHLMLLDRFKSAFHEQARVPEVTAGKLDGIGQLSGLAMRILYGPLMRKVNVCRGLYGHLLDETNRRLLDLAEYEAVETAPRWPQVLPSDPLVDAQAASARQAAGVSIETTLDEMGLDPIVEAERRQQEREDERGSDLAGALSRFNAGE